MCSLSCGPVAYVLGVFCTLLADPYPGGLFRVDHLNELTDWDTNTDWHTNTYNQTHIIWGPCKAKNMDKIELHLQSGFEISQAFHYFIWYKQSSDIHRNSKVFTTTCQSKSLVQKLWHNNNDSIHTHKHNEEFLLFVVGWWNKWPSRDMSIDKWSIDTLRVSSDRLNEFSCLFPSPFNQAKS